MLDIQFFLLRVKLLITPVTLWLTGIPRVRSDPEPSVGVTEFLFFHCLQIFRERNTNNKKTHPHFGLNPMFVLEYLRWSLPVLG